ncbi:MAG: undecaprenyl-diphosphate phosphatase [Puniceicoccales bacterium]|jgi:undecaprenyl-diphosphatase|nr:undecaprenyl-diphosphate phosphatase [Puniceicoccales bacterium]
MKRFFIKTLGIVIIFIFAKTSSLSAEPKNEFLDKYATTLGIIQGATEFLPISSTAHMIIFERVVTPRHSGCQQNITPNGHTIHEFGIVIQLGSVLAMIFLYFNRIKLILSGIFFLNIAGLNLLLKLIFGVIPCVIVGLMISDFLKKLCTPSYLATSLAIGALIMLLAENFYEKTKKEKKENFDEISYKNALFIGLCQCIAFIPGASRSMTTIVGGYLSNLSRSVSIEFSFLLGTVTMTLAATYKLLFSSANLMGTIPLSCSIKGTLAAFITSLLLMKLSIYILKRYGLYLFAIYRILLATTIIFLVNFT